MNKGKVKARKEIVTQIYYPIPMSFKDELARIINVWGLDSLTNIPDFVLADILTRKILKIKEATDV